ncbi:MAG TPA: hypothetical protein VG605_20125 [Puia sp.]|nr:hypothetical protein [Puia sp.]
MENHIIPIHFNGLGVEYKGWAVPSSEQHEDGHPKHYQVVLNKMFIGNFRLNRGKWFADEQPPQELVAAVGACLDTIPSRHRPLAS